MATERITGLSNSGIDVDALVKKMMATKRKPYDKMYQQKTRTEWKKTAYNDFYKELTDFRSEMVNFKLQSTLSPKKTNVTNTGSTGNTTNVLTATANADAVNVTHTVNVTQIAQSASMTSTDKIGFSEDSKNLADILGDISGGLSLTLADGTTTKNDKGEQVANTKTLTYTADQLKKMTIYDLTSDMSKAGLNIKASYDENLDRLFVYNSQSGKDNQITMSAKDGEGNASDNGKLLLQKLNLLDAAATGDTVSSTDQTADGKDKFIRGLNAEAVIDGVAVSEASNNFTIAGVNYSLQNKGETRVQIESDVDKQVSVVKDFVEKYNKLLTSMNDKLSESYYKDYAPLTDAQKEEMSESEIKKWEEKAQSGMLHNDPTIKKLVSKFRTAVSDAVSGASGDYTSLSSIGVTTNWQEKGGKLYVDETKLKEALTTDSNALSKIFSTNGTDSKSSIDDGVAVRLYDTMVNIADEIAETAGTPANKTTDTSSTMAKQITRYTEKMTALNKKLQDWETAYYNKFAKMEQTLSQLTNQMNSLMSNYTS